MGKLLISGSGEGHSKIRATWIVHIVVGCVFSVGFYYMASKFGIDVGKNNAYYFFMGGAVLFPVITLIGAFSSTKQIRNTSIDVYEDRIEGLAYPSEFELTYNQEFSVNVEYENLLVVNSGNVKYTIWVMNAREICDTIMAQKDKQSTMAQKNKPSKTDGSGKIMDKYSAIVYGNVEDVKSLIEKENVNINDRSDSKGRSLVFLAAMFDKIDIVKYLAERGADLDARDNSDASPMDVAVMGGKIDLIKCLAKCGAKVNAKNRDGETPMFTAAMQGKTTSIECLIGLGADVNTRNKDGLTPIFKAAQFRQVGVIECLVAHGANVNATDTVGMTPVFLAAGSGQTECVERLVARGANVNATAKNGMTAIFLAAAEGQLDCVKCLVWNGAEVNITAKGMTPLVLATECGHSHVVEWLRANGAR